jgi:hypothetical protein
MDIFGNVIRECMRRAHEQEVKQAYVIAKDFKKDGLKIAEIEEMLYSSGYDQTTVEEALKMLGK